MATLADLARQQILNKKALPSNYYSEFTTTWKIIFEKLLEAFFCQFLS